VDNINILSSNTKNSLLLKEQSLENYKQRDMILSAKKEETNKQLKFLVKAHP